MKVYNYVPGHFGHGIKRIAAKLEQYAPPHIKFVNERSQADVVLLHTVGAQETSTTKPTEQYVVFQYCYITAGMDKYYWNNIWQRAVGVVSYYDLRSEFTGPVNFVHTPLGADSREFFHTNTRRTKKVFATGHVAETESLDILWQACFDTKTTLYHTGENFRFGAYYKYLPYMSQSDLCRLLNEVEFVSCLRTIEGFELLGVEGLFCGARPIVLDLPCYDWYRDYSYTVRQTHLYTDLVGLLKSTPAPVSVSEFEEITAQFEWGDIVENIYQELGF